jgi:hypothetical protein
MFPCCVIPEAMQVLRAPTGRVGSTNHVTSIVDLLWDRQNCTGSVDRRIGSASEQESVRGSRRINPRNQRSTGRSTWEELRRSSVPLIPQRESQLLAGTSQKRTLAENCISRGVPEPTGLTGVVVLTV